MSIINRLYRYNLLSDKLYLQIMYRLRMGQPLNLENPTTFTEKMQWLKLYNRKPEYVIMADKVKAKEWVAQRIGKEYVIPTLGVWERAEDIDFASLPNRFVIKCNHNSGKGMYICKDKTKMDEHNVRDGLSKGLKEDYFHHNGEWPYKDVPRRIIAEQFMEENGNSGDLKDYKFFCFNGKVKFFKIDFDRFTNHGANYYSPDGKLLEFGEAEYPPKPEKELDLPANLSIMITFAEELSKDLPFLRVDFYSINNRIYFGELTFYPSSGMGKFTSFEWDKNIGSMITFI